MPLLKPKRPLVISTNISALPGQLLWQGLFREPYHGKDVLQGGLALQHAALERPQDISAFRAVKRVSDWLEKITFHLCSVLVFVMFVIVMVQIFSRMFGSSVSWTEELSRFLLVWIGLLAASIALKQGGHAGIEFFVERLSDELQTHIRVICAVIMLIFLVYFTYYAWNAALGAGAIRSTALEIKMTWPRLALPVGGFLMGVSALYLMLANINQVIREWKKE